MCNRLPSHEEKEHVQLSFGRIFSLPSRCGARFSVLCTKRNDDAKINDLQVETTS